jgi:polyphosphate kinase
VVRDEGTGVRSYCHIGTGNYNAKTAKLYEDLGILTADPLIGADLAQLFNFLTGYGRNVQYRRLLVAPHPLRSRLYELIDGEIGAPGGGHIVLKMNSLVDPDMIDRLYSASQAGVKIELLIRGICCLRPGVPGLSDTITVRSLIGRYLEHSRIFHFANGAGPGAAITYICSADLMPRNLDRRIEALVPVIDPLLQRRVMEILQVCMADDTLAWSLGPDGAWRRVASIDAGGTVDAHLRFQELALARGRRADVDVDI